MQNLINVLHFQSYNPGILAGNPELIWKCFGAALLVLYVEGHYDDFILKRFSLHVGSCKRLTSENQVNSRLVQILTIHE